MSPGPGFYFDGGGRRAALDELFDGLHRSGEPLFVIGEPGSGRSLLIERFCIEVDPDVLAVAVVVGDILMSSAQCLSLMAESFSGGGAAPAGDPATAVAGILAAGRTPVLVVDDAQELGEQPRAEIAAFCAAHGVLLVWVGDGSLVRDAEQAPIVLRAFTEPETEEFVAAWLAVDAEDELPSHRTMERLHRQAGGMPGRLAALLADGAATRNTWFPAGFPVWHVVFTVGAAIFLLALLTWFVPASQAPVAAPAEIAIPLPTPQQERADASSPGTRLSAVAVPRPVEIAPLPVTEAAAADDAAGAVVTPVPLPTPAATPAPAPGRRYSDDESALLKERASRYTLQLFASFNEQAVRQFVAAHPAVDIRVFRTVREELPWHVAVTGSYRSKDEAKAAVAKLPPGLRKLEPWARSLQGVQDELRRRKD
ncbi:MAG: SPOR domain-containing protein [Pseudomonadota bacterium]